MINWPFLKKNQDEIDTIGKLSEEAVYEKSSLSLKDVITPAGLSVTSTSLQFSDRLVKTLFVLSYPKYLTVGWLSPVINTNQNVNLSIFFHPMDTESVLKNLRKRSTQLQAQYMEEQGKGLIRNPVLETAIQDIEGLRDSLTQGRDKMFYLGCYITIMAADQNSLSVLESEITGLLGQKMVEMKPAVFQQLEAYESCLPIGTDRLNIKTPLNVGPVSTSFPFISSQLISDSGIFYGVSLQNNSPVIFDRFSLENSNSVIFAKSGAGKSYFTKLEIIRSLMWGTKVLVIDPENEYKHLTEALGGSFFRIAIDSADHLNPFDITTVADDEDPASAFRQHVIDLIGLIRVMVGELSPEQEAILDQAIKQTYASRDITPETPFFGKEPPVISDLEQVLESMEGGKSIAEKLYKYTKGSFAGFVNQPTTIDVANRFAVFSIRDLDEELRPVAMYMILNYIWNLIRKTLERRILVVDEAWYMMKNNDSANFLLSVAKRSRKYYLGLTTITQDVDDFLKSPYGKPIITNSSLQFLMKQASAAIPSLQQVFSLSPAETDLLTNLSVGEGLLFAGTKHQIIKAVPSYTEDQIITTNPEQLLKIKQAKEEIG
ncbi:MAG: Type IV secretory pathway VirB4 component-like protein [Parcubacteria group bacterium GW2011_GWB1_46_8]|nr:MAG: Type IV secretory pathway VirB4 component-like protein [Parcubacteria group bacterium GW2011_GWF1_45_5]KKU46428.1 MAG: Type IV secretory pathway VirB4 component-like protein [Parcubacteria group bacterium GW2011_GWB1_46_8]